MTTCQENQNKHRLRHQYIMGKKLKDHGRAFISTSQGPLHGSSFFWLWTDSKWLEVLHVPSMSANCTIKRLRSLLQLMDYPRP
ncbi:hypothetical protein JTE90_016198 [Oedothorax gibbosus]|uniref:Uncharacterized protein n=1 Tax=Oedothorax gibbosus TaxID=931172 RepID=A0AAV6TK50_9ARAC|nr:hypothetical protein JTE90_016198 [Oedothorax gibbosus]